MRLLIIRHADAGDRDEFAATGRPDSERPLSPRGTDQMRNALASLKVLVPDLDQVITSHYARARQTAELVRRAYRAGPLRETDTLEPEAHPRAFVQYLIDVPGDVIACVGHEPHLSELLAWLTVGQRAGYADLKKGGACLLKFSGPARKGRGRLRWLLGPNELAK